MSVRLISKRYQLVCRSVAALCICTLVGCSEPDDALGNQPNMAGTSAPKLSAQAPLVLTSSDVSARSLITKETSDRLAMDKLMVRVKRVMGGYLKDPASAQYEAVRAGRNGGVCLRVNGKNGYGAYVGMTPFIITKTDFVVRRDDSYYEMFYLDICATDEERARAREAELPVTDAEETPLPDYAEAANRIAESSGEEQSDPFANLE